MTDIKPGWGVGGGGHGCGGPPGWGPPGGVVVRGVGWKENPGQVI